MIIEFCVRNFLSIKDEMKHSFLATTLKDKLSELNVPAQRRSFPPRSGVVHPKGQF